MKKIRKDDNRDSLEKGVPFQLRESNLKVLVLFTHSLKILIAIYHFNLKHFFHLAYALQNKEKFAIILKCRFL